MFQQLRKLIGHSAIYGLGLVGSSITSMILIPVFLHRLDKTQYGISEVLNVMSSMVLFVSTLGIGVVLIKVYLNDCETEEDRKTLISSVLLFATGIAILMSGLAYVLAKPVALRWFGDRRLGFLVQMGVAGSGLMLIQQMTVLCLRAKQWAGRFVFVTLAQLGVVVLANLYLVWYRRMGVVGIQIGAITGALVSLALGLVMIRSELIRRFSRTSVIYVLSLSWPLMPATIVPWVLNYSDRFFLLHYAGLAVVGLYAVGYKIGMLGILVPVNAFQLAWSPLFFANRDSEDAPRLCATVLKYYAVVLVGCGLLVSVFAHEILRVISSRQYWSASWLIPFVALAYIMYGVQAYAIPMFINVNKTKWLGTLTVSYAALNILLNIILIPRYGMLGAMSATLGAFFVQAVVNTTLANRFYPVPHEYWSFVKTAIAGAIVYLVFSRVAGASTMRILLKLLALPSFGVLLLAMKFFGARELAVLYSIPARALRRMNPSAAADRAA